MLWKGGCAMNKEQYEEMEIEIITFDSEDIITASAGGENVDIPLP